MIIFITVIISILFGVICLGWFIGFSIKILWEIDEESYFIRPLIKYVGIFMAFIILMLLLYIALG